MGVVVLVACLVGGFFYLKRRRQAQTNQAYELGSTPASYHDNDRKEYYRHQGTHELPIRHPPQELSAEGPVELPGSGVGGGQEEEKPAR